MKLLKIWNASKIPRKWLRRERLLRTNAQLEAYVKSIIKEVKTKGDSALIRFAKEFDNVQLTIESLKVCNEEISEAYEKVSEDQISAVKSVKKRLETVEKRLLERVNFDVKLGEACIKFRTNPIERVGCYVPGGKAAYPSTFLMTVVPAMVAGVSSIAVCSPPSANGLINPLTLVAADICGVDEIYRVGGAQAIAAMAYGTETIKPVKKIVGPGNIYVTLAKILVSRHVAIDLPAGPSELLVLADETANPRFIALDMCAQAEHGPDSIVGLLTLSKKLAREVIAELENIAYSAPRSSIVVKALLNNGFIILCKNVDEMVYLANLFAAEHVEVMMKNPEKAAAKISTAGLVLVGPYSSASLSDYYIGTNHILPTNGFGKIFSGLSSLDFTRRTAIVNCPKDELSEAIKTIKILSEAENLPGHFKAVEGRLKFENSNERLD